MKQLARLPDHFRPKSCIDLVRLGKLNDGGYVVSERSISHAEAFVSGGINDDWSFEKAAVGSRPMVAFDPTIGLKGYFRRLMSKRRSLRRIRSYLVAVVRARLFFHNKRKLVFQALGPTAGGIGLRAAVAEHLGDTAKNIFLKLDIEGSEYDLLDEILFLSDRLTGVVIEFHNVADNIRKIEDFMQRFSHGLIHVHCNNHSTLSPQKIPSVIELSFSRYIDREPSDKDYPTLLDQPNDPRRPDFKLSFGAACPADFGP